jgi:hypothetical protein
MLPNPTTLNHSLAKPTRVLSIKPVCTSIISLPFFFYFTTDWPRSYDRPMFQGFSQIQNLPLLPRTHEASPTAISSVWSHLIYAPTSLE